MSRKERDRVTIMAGVTKQELTLVQGSELMGVGYENRRRAFRRSGCIAVAGKQVWAEMMLTKTN
jgi:hypothetical protein